jgi:hypothetical protein
MGVLRGSVRQIPKMADVASGTGQSGLPPRRVV